MSNYRKTMAEALREMYPLTEETQLDEAEKRDAGYPDDSVKIGKKHWIIYRDRKYWYGYEVDKKGNQIGDVIIGPKTGGAGNASYKASAKSDLKKMLAQESVDLDERMRMPRQLIDTNKEVMIVKKNKVIVIDKKDQDKYMKQGWELAEEVGLNEGTIDKVKEIASKKQAMKIDGVMVDSFTASAISQIYDKVNDANKKKMDSLPITKLANLAFKMMQKNDYVPEEVDLDENLNQIKKHIDDLEFERKRMTTSGQESLDKLIKAKSIKDARKAFDDMYGYEYDRVTSSGQESMVKIGKMLGIKMEEVDLDEGKMSQLHQYIKDKKSAEEIAKLMGLDVKTIKALMSSHHPEDVEEGAAADARRAMSRDKDFSRKDSADDDTDASADDVKGASKNIMMQMRKAQSLNGRFDVEFGDGKKVKIPAKMAIAVQSKYNKMRRPAEKEKFQAKVGKSYRDMLSALKEELQPKKESVLDRIDRKIKEKNDG